ncbi:hypothetical protein SYNPS1DRAFT_30383 [Syncephalis pseudoplumigaleata]|uniref:Uncharacterized protein n=1 Tax=Syncephalis pseudoplumigaleata TaxID=1712513 RepID=A0A4P9YVL6_9FUNG|nr:hypothetical protein SYNPS1DRAFT_30383 [Syncephalis pseudoplumigaleata]|eukprot:RKP23855.1 hypothetical protein SYNPS1DRAFT_30383 [Syncephalis pseudoplumigaleata]
MEIITYPSVKLKDFRDLIWEEPLFREVIDGSTIEELTEQSYHSVSNQYKKAIFLTRGVTNDNGIMECIKGWARRFLKLTDPQELRTYIRDNFEFYHFLEFSKRISEDIESVSEKFKDYNSFLRKLQSISMGVVMSGASLLCMTGYIIAEKDNLFDPMGEPIKGKRILTCVHDILRRKRIIKSDGADIFKYLIDAAEVMLSELVTENRYLSDERVPSPYSVAESLLGIEN